MSLFGSVAINCSVVSLRCYNAALLSGHLAYQFEAGQAAANGDSLAAVSANLKIRRWVRPRSLLVFMGSMHLHHRRVDILDIVESLILLACHSTCLCSSLLRRKHKISDARENSSDPVPLEYCTGS